MDLVWRGLDPDEPSLEHLCLTPWTRAEGTVVGIAGGQPYTLNYHIEIGGDDHPSFVGTDVAGGGVLTLRRAAKGTWTGGRGLALPALEGCTDVNIRVTPFTSTLPLRRLGLSVGESGTLLAARVDVSSLAVRAARQRYTRTGDATYRHEDLESGCVSEMEVDAYGLVTLSPGAFERVQPGRQS